MPGLGNGFLQARPGDGLEQIVQRIHFESVHGVLVIGGGENKKRKPGFLLEQLLDHSEAVQARHLHVEKDQVGIQVSNEAHRLESIPTLPHNLDIGKTL